MKKTTGPYPVLTVDSGGSSVVPNAGAALLLRTAQTVGLPAVLSEALAPWRRPLAIHDPAKIVLDLAVSLAIGGDCLADIAQLRAAPEVFGVVASDSTRTAGPVRLGRACWSSGPLEATGWGGSG